MFKRLNEQIENFNNECNNYYFSEYTDYNNYQNYSNIENIENYPLIANAIIKLYEKDHGNREIEPHNSIVIGVIDGKTNYWNCGLWYYKAFDGETSLNPVQDFAPEEGYKITADGYIPIFTAIL